MWLFTTSLPECLEKECPYHVTTYHTPPPQSCAYELIPKTRLRAGCLGLLAISAQVPIW